jgi:hypothetical protein
MRVSTWVVSFMALAALGAVAAHADSRTVELSCVNKAGENMYRASDGSVVWTDSCGHEPRCAEAIVHFGSTANSRTIHWIGGGTCHVVNAAFSRGAGRGNGSGRAPVQRPKSRRKS